MRDLRRGIRREVRRYEKSRNHQQYVERYHPLMHPRNFFKSESEVVSLYNINRFIQRTVAYMCMLRNDQDEIDQNIRFPSWNSS